MISAKLLSVPIVAVQIRDEEIGLAIARDVLSRHEQHNNTRQCISQLEPRIWESPRPFAFRLEWSNHFEQLYPDDVSLAKAANILMDRGSQL